MNNKVFIIINMADADLFFKHAVIPPPKEFSIKDNNDVNRYHRVVIDSTFRDTSLFPTPSKYDFGFDEEYTDVISASLLNADIPFSMYLINKYFNTFIMNDTRFIIPEGDYTIYTLVNAIRVLLPDFIIDTDTITSKITITNSIAFTFNPNNLDKLLGFLPQVYISVQNGSTYSVTASFKYNLNYNNCIIMYINGFDSLKSSITQYNRAFAIITRENNKLNINNKLEINFKYASALRNKVINIHIKNTIIIYNVNVILWIFGYIINSINKI